MRFKHVLIISIIWIGGILAYKFWPEERVVHAAGVLVSDAPFQRTIESGRSWNKNGYNITPLAEFTLRARVLHKKLYSRGREADLSPVDLALGWGKMSDQNILDQITITQHSRWYYWHADKLPIPRDAVISSSSNMHMIPSSEEVEQLVSSVREGSLVQLSGYLVAVSARDGWKWKSSLSRKDTGNGSCEVVWVKSARIE